MNRRYITIISCLSTTILLAVNGCVTTMQPKVGPKLSENANKTMALPAFSPSKPEVLAGAEKSTSVNLAEHIKSFDIKGAIGVQDAKEAWSATLDWQQLGSSHYQVNLVGPAGAGSVFITAKPGAVKLVNSKNQTFVAKNSEELFKQQTGVYLPVSNLYYWIRGLAVPHLPVEKTLDKANHIVMMKQQGWLIEYTRYTKIQGVDLPVKIIASNPQMKIKMVINSWQVGRS